MHRYWRPESRCHLKLVESVSYQELRHIISGEMWKLKNEYILTSLLVVMPEICRAPLRINIGSGEDGEKRRHSSSVPICSNCHNLEVFSPSYSYLHRTPYSLP